MPYLGYNFCACCLLSQNLPSLRLHLGGSPLHLTLVPFCFRCMAVFYNLNSYQNKTLLCKSNMTYSTVQSFSPDCYFVLILNLYLFNIFRWNQPVCPSMRPWSQSLTTRHTSVSVKPRDAAGLRTSTPELRSGQSEKPLSFLWSASVRWCCSEASSLTRRQPLHVLDRNTVRALACNSSWSLSVLWLVSVKSFEVTVLA